MARIHDLSKYDIEAYCERCVAVKVKLLKDKEDGFLICPRCGNRLDIFGNKGRMKVFVIDEPEPLAAYLKQQKKEGLIEKEVKSLKSKGYTVKKVEKLN